MEPNKAPGRPCTITPPRQSHVPLLETPAGARLESEGRVNKNRKTTAVEGYCAETRCRHRW